MKFVIFFLSSVLMFGCSKIYLSKKVIQNDSEQKIRVIIYSKIHERYDSITIDSQKEKVIEEFAPSNSDPAYLTVNGCANPPNAIITLEVYDKPSSLRVNKDISNSDNWVLDKSSNHNELTVECRFRITDADIVQK